MQQQPSPDFSALYAQRHQGPRLTREEAALAFPEADAAIRMSPKRVAPRGYWRFYAASVVEERVRILTIEKLDGPPDLKRQCIEDGSSVTATALLINEAHQAKRRAAAAAIQADEDQLEPPTPLHPDVTDPTSSEALARQIVATGERLFTPTMLSRGGAR